MVEELRDSAAIVKLARVLAIFYLPPPVAGDPSDGFPAGAGNADAAQAARMFVLVHLFADQVAGDAARMRDHGLQFHAIRHPEARSLALAVPGAAAPKLTPSSWVVFPLSEVLRAVRVFPAAWRVSSADLVPRALSGSSETHDRHREDAAATHGPVLVFIPPLSGTRWPMFVPQPENNDDDEE